MVFERVKEIIVPRSPDNEHCFHDTINSGSQQSNDVRQIERSCMQKSFFLHLFLAL